MPVSSTSHCGGATITETMEQRPPPSPKRCASSKCKKKRWWHSSSSSSSSSNKSINLRACHLCGQSLCHHCQEVVMIDPELAYWETVAENYNPHGDPRPVCLYRLLPGELYDARDYIAFCLKCSKTQDALVLIHSDRERKASLNFVPDATQ